MFTVCKTTTLPRSESYTIHFQLCTQDVCRYCRRTFQEQPDDQGSIFLALLKLYLGPKEEGKALFAPALGLLARHGSRIDLGQVMTLLPPLVAIEDLFRFLLQALRRSSQTHRDLRAEREVLRARTDQVQRAEVLLQSQHVKITDSRLCPICHKRLGNSVISVHMPL